MTWNVCEWMLFRTQAMLINLGIQESLTVTPTFSETAFTRKSDGDSGVFFKGQSYNIWKNKTSPKDVLKDQFELLGKHQIFVYKYHMISNKPQYILTARSNFLSTFQRQNVSLLIVMISNKCKQFLRSQTWPYNTVVYQLGSRFATFGFIEKS
jgi:hypothetical protein